MPPSAPLLANTSGEYSLLALPSLRLSGGRPFSEATGNKTVATDAVARQRRRDYEEMEEDGPLAGATETPSSGAE